MGQYPSKRQRQRVALQHEYVYRDHGTYDIDEMIDIAKDFDSYCVPIEELTHSLEICQVLVDNEEVSLKNIMDNPIQYTVVMNAIMQANLSYPILAYDSVAEGPLDGPPHQQVMSSITADDVGIQEFDGNKESSESESAIKRKYDILHGEFKICKAMVIGKKNVQVRLMPRWVLVSTKVADSDIKFVEKDILSVYCRSIYNGSYFT